MTRSFTIDTNILIYASDTADAAKKLKARSLLAKMAEVGCVFPLQCLNEFYSATTNKGLLTSRDAERVVRHGLRSFQIVVPEADDLAAAIGIHRDHRVQFL